jgi:hypothetical protein
VGLVALAKQLRSNWESFRSSGVRTLGAGLTSLYRGIDLSNKNGGRDRAVSPSGVEVGTGTRVENLLLCFTLLHQFLYAVANSGQHFAVGVYVRSGHDLAMHGDDSKVGVDPTAHDLDDAIEISSVSNVNTRVAVARKIFSEVEQVGCVKMHEDLGVVATARLMDEVDGFVIQIEGEDFGERDAGPVDARAELDVAAAAWVHPWRARPNDREHSPASRQKLRELASPRPLRCGPGLPT